MDDDFAEFREAQRLLTTRRYSRWLTNCGLLEGPIEFRNPVEIDDYGTVTIGEWGGYLIQVMPMIFNDRLVMTPQSCPGTYDHGWCYDKGPAAVLAAMAWNPETQAEPIGYKKRATPGLREPNELAGGFSEASARAFGLMLALDLLDATSAGPDR